MSGRETRPPTGGLALQGQAGRPVQPQMRGEFRTAEHVRVTVRRIDTEPREELPHRLRPGRCRVIPGTRAHLCGPKILQLNHRAHGERMVIGEQHDHPLLTDRLSPHRRGAGGIRAEADVRADRRLGRSPAVSHDVLDLGGGASCRLQHASGRGPRSHCVDDQGSDIGAQIADGAVVQGDEVACTIQQTSSLRGQHDPAGRPVQQTHSRRLLQSTHVTAQRLLCDEEATGRTPEVQLLRDGDEAAEESDLEVCRHGPILSAP